MRLEANISVSKNNIFPNYKVEITDQNIKDGVDPQMTKAREVLDSM